MLSTCNRTELYLAREEHADDEAVDALARAGRRPGRRSRRRAVSPAGRGCGAPPVPRRRRARLARSRRGRDPRPGAGGVRSRRHRPVPRPALPPGAARGQARSDGDRDQREPGLGPVGGGRAGPAGVRRPCRAPRPRCSAPGRSASPPPATFVTRGAEIAVVANRTLAHGEDLARKLGARAIALDAVATELERADVVVSATSASELRPLARVGRRSASCAQGPSAPAARPRGPPRPRSRDQRARRLLPLRRRRPRGSRDRDALRPAWRGGACRAARRRRGRSLPRMAGLARRRPDDRVAPRAAPRRSATASSRRPAGRLSERERKHIESVTSQIVAKLLHLPDDPS